MAFSSAGDDFSDTFDSSGTIAINSEATGNLEVVRDKDWFRVELNAGDRYVFTMVRPDDSSDLDEPFLVLRDGDGNFLLQADSSDPRTLSARIGFEPATSGTYWLEARSIANDTGDYRIIATSQDDIFDDDFGDTRDETTPLPLNNLIGGQIDEPGDQDWLSVSLIAGQRYTLEITATEGADSSLADLYLVMRDANNTFAAQASAVDANGAATFTPIVSGDYSIAVRDYGGGVGSYELVVKDQEIDRFESQGTDGDILASTSSTATLGVGERLGGSISSSSDSDWYKMTLTANTEYLINLEASDPSDEFSFDVGGVLNEAQIIIRDADGSFLTEEVGFGDENAPNQVSFIPQTTGDYWVDIRGFGDTGSYIVTLSDEGESTDDFPANTSSTGTLSINNPATGELEVEGDSDWFSVSLSAGFEHLFTVTADPSKQPPDINLVLRDSNGTFIDQYPGSADGNFFVFQVPQSGNYWIEIQSVNDLLLDNIGTYELSFIGSEPLPESSSQSSLAAPSQQAHDEGKAESGYAVNELANGFDGFQLTADI